MSREERLSYCALQLLFKTYRVCSAWAMVTMEISPCWCWQGAQFRSTAKLKTWVVTLESQFQFSHGTLEIIHCMAQCTLLTLIAAECRIIIKSVYQMSNTGNHSNSNSNTSWFCATLCGAHWSSAFEQELKKLQVEQNTSSEGYLLLFMDMIHTVHTALIQPNTASSNVAFHKKGVYAINPKHLQDHHVIWFTLNQCYISLMLFLSYVVHWTPVRTFDDWVQVMRTVEYSR